MIKLQRIYLHTLDRAIALRYFASALSILYIMNFNFFNFLKRNSPPPKKGIALGSGGAKGMAHIGVLKALDEENINFDVVCGTSIGSVVGGMYAAGYSSASMIQYISDLSFFEPQSLIKLKLAGKTVESLLDEIMGGAHFDELLLPFAAIATDYKKGEEVAITNGNVAKAMRASSAIPPLLKAIEIDGKSLVDGAFLNSVPSDVCKKMGANFVIGVNLSANVPNNDRIKPVLDELYKDNNVPYTDRAKAGRQFSDVLITPDLSEFSSATLSKDKFEKMFEIGYDAAKAKIPEIKEKLKKAKMPL